MKLFIDNKELEMDQEAQVSISLSIASITQVESGRTGYAKTIRVPITAQNRQILGDVEEIFSLEMFNQKQHSAHIEVDGCVVIQGQPMITKYEKTSNAEAWYHINIIGPGKEWIKMAAEKQLNELEIPFNKMLDSETVIQSWQNDQAVKFLPVQRDRFTLDSGNVQGRVRMLSFEDYFPFIHVRSMMERIAAQAGYTIESQFMQEELFNSLHMSGKYTESDTENRKDKMGFLAKRFAAIQGTADRFGRVYADPLTSLNSIGNVVDSADPEEVVNGISLSGVYNQSNSFRKINGFIAFYPPETSVVGFEYFLKYRTEYRIKNRSELTCFNRVYLEDFYERIFKVMNPNVDRKAQYRDNWGYQLMVFDHIPGESYRFTYDRAGVGMVTLKTFNSRTTPIQTQLGTTISNPRLWLDTGGGNYIPYTGDWALYDGYVTETGEVDVAVTVRTPARTVYPSAPQYFDVIHFGGATPGMKITLSPETSLKPIFVGHPCEGTQVEFQQVAAHQVRQIHLINALKQMFNLYFYTDSNNKKIYIEPREMFYRNDVEVDWSQKIDLRRPITVEELGADMNEQFALSYQPGDGSVARWDSVNNQVMGRWSTPINNRFSKEGVKTYQNPLFSPTLNQTEIYPDAPEISMIQVGDRDRKGNVVSTDNLNFEPKIVRYQGLVPLSGNAWWGWPSFGQAYPKIAFHNTTGNPFTLCFENRDGITGLHSFYDKTIEHYNFGKRITLYLNLSPCDIEPFIAPNSLKKDFRALFKLIIYGEEVRCRMEEIIDYNPSGSSSTKCSFLKYV